MTGSLISAAARRHLQRLKDAEDRDDFDDAEIVCEGRECYIGTDAIAKRVVFELLRLCLLKDESEQGKGVERYTINEEGRAIAATRSRARQRRRREE